MTSLAADEGGAEGGDGAGPNKRPKEGTVGAEVLDTERLAWCTRILNQVSSGTRIIPPCVWLWTAEGMTTALTCPAVMCGALGRTIARPAPLPGLPL